MKTMKKAMALLLVATMLLALSVNVFAAASVTGSLATATDTNHPASITITKKAIVDDEGTSTSNYSADTYTFYRLFSAVTDGTGISYRKIASTLPNGFYEDAAGNVYMKDSLTDAGITATAYEALDATAKAAYNTVPATDGNYYLKRTSDSLTADEIAAIQTYVNANSSLLYGTASSPASDSSVVVHAAYGYYFIETTSGTVVTVDSTKPNATVDDKNIVPYIEKTTTETNNVQDAGTSIPYTITVHAQKGAENYVVSDTMTNMVLDGDVTVTVDGSTVAAGASTYSIVKGTNDVGFTITFVDTYIASITATGAKDIVITYNAKITDDGLQVDPSNNTATLTYGEGSSVNSTPATNDDEVKFYNAKITVTKTDGNNVALAGAGFVLKNAAGKYYKLTTDTTTGFDFVSWVDSVSDATELTTTTGTDGNVINFTGLGSGTYTLVENTVPTGYNKAADQEFTVVADNITANNLAQSATVVNNQGTELPSTGGIGTTIFYVVGGILVLAAVVVLVSRRRMSAEK